MTGKYQRSLCKRKGWLHDYRLQTQYMHGVVEKCEKCGDRKYFPLDIDNATYLSYHIRSAIQLTDERFEHEYGKR